VRLKDASDAKLTVDGRPFQLCLKIT